MKRQSDEEWLAAARRRYAVEGPHFDIAPDFSPADDPIALAPSLVCPTCVDGPILERFPHYVLATPIPIEVCRRCYGIWAPAGSLGAGIRADAASHPALAAAKAPPRCRACFGWLMPDGACAKCKQAAPAIACPACRMPMDRNDDGAGNRLDHCGACAGTWFETGEFPAVYGITFEKSLVERSAEYRDAENAATLGGILGAGTFPMSADGTPEGGSRWWAAGLHVLALLLRLRF